MTSHHHPSLARSRRKVSFTNLAVIHQLTGPSGSHKRTKRSKHSGGIESDDTRISNPRVVSFLSPSGASHAVFPASPIGKYPIFIIASVPSFQWCAVPLNLRGRLRSQISLR